MIYEFTTLAKSWWFLANSIFILKELRENNNSVDDIRSINATMVLNVAATVEGAITSHFERNLKSHAQYKESAGKNDFVTRAAFDNVFEDLESKGFTRKIELYKQFLQLDLKQMADYKAIDALIHFRNVLAHGGTFKLKTKRVDDWVVGDYHKPEDRNEIVSPLTSWTKPSLISYLKEKSLIEVDENKEWKVIFDALLLNSNVADYFVNSAKEFIMKMFDSEGLTKSLLESHIIQYLGESRPKFPQELLSTVKKVKK